MLLKKYKCIGYNKYLRIKLCGKFICNSCKNNEKDFYRCTEIMSNGRSLYDECLLASEYYKYNEKDHLYDYIPSDYVIKEI